MNHPRLPFQSELDQAIKAVDDEPELPGEMLDEMWEAIRDDRDATAAALASYRANQPKP